MIIGSYSSKRGTRTPWASVDAREGVVTKVRSSGKSERWGVYIMGSCRGRCGYSTWGECCEW